MILFILKISESEQFDDAQLKGKNRRSFKRKGIGYNKMTESLFGKDSQIVQLGNDQLTRG
jgi:hypothetical protein